MMSCSSSMRDWIDCVFIVGISFKGVKSHPNRWLVVCTFCVTMHSISAYSSFMSLMAPEIVLPVTIPRDLNISSGDFH